MPMEQIKSSKVLRAEREKVFVQMEGLKNQIIGLNTSINIVEKIEAEAEQQAERAKKLGLPGGDPLGGAMSGRFTGVGHDGEAE